MPERAVLCTRKMEFFPIFDIFRDPVSGEVPICSQKPFEKPCSLVQKLMKEKKLLYDLFREMANFKLKWSMREGTLIHGYCAAVNTMSHTTHNRAQKPQKGPHFAKRTVMVLPFGSSSVCFWSALWKDYKTFRCLGFF